MSDTKTSQSTANPYTEQLSGRDAVALYTVLEKFKPPKVSDSPSEPGIYWVSLDGEPFRICEVIPCTALDKRPKGSLKLSFTQAEEATRWDKARFIGPLTPPL